MSFTICSDLVKNVEMKRLMSEIIQYFLNHFVPASTIMKFHEAVTAPLLVAMGSGSPMAHPPLSILGLVLVLLLTAQVSCQLNQEIFEDVFDDQYIGCTDRMDALAPEILRTEMEASDKLKWSWNFASQFWKRRKIPEESFPLGFKNEYGIALFAYSIRNFGFSKLLNNGVMTYGRDPRSFQFHAMHFYLTRALALLQPGCKGEPLTVYGSLSRSVTWTPQATVRLAGLNDASSDIKVVENTGNISLVISTCFGVELLNMSYNHSYKEALIPLTEVFRVSSYDEEQKKMTLQSTYRKCSYYNCAYLGGEKSQDCGYVTESSVPSRGEVSRASAIPRQIVVEKDSHILCSVPCKYITLFAPNINRIVYMMLSEAGNNLRVYYIVKNLSIINPLVTTVCDVGLTGAEKLQMALNDAVQLLAVAEA
ncbi:ecto-ADP-ribosyltransferase 5-like [Engystomops pustulosus]|uniref:ecto-ADP-ribosyltransferase 5-like n=1 Tax=Engystomops pustulosus TaxID=76066 RepID=UPI003AFB0CC0